MFMPCQGRVPQRPIGLCLQVFELDLITSAIQAF